MQGGKKIAEGGYGCVYYPALKNDGKETLKFYWIFPTNTFSEVEYFY